MSASDPEGKMMTGFLSDLHLCFFMQQKRQIEIFRFQKEKKAKGQETSVMAKVNIIFRVPFFGSLLPRILRILSELQASSHPSKTFSNSQSQTSHITN